MPSEAAAGRTSLSPAQIAVSGAAAAVLGIGLFIAVHAILIVPIWPTAMRSVVAVVIGMSGAWAFEELTEAGALSRRLFGGAAFGGILWLILVPMNAFGALLRLTGLRSAFGVWELVVEIALVLGMSTAIGWWLTRRKRGAFALSVVAVLLTFLTGGPLPMTASRPAIGLFVSLLLIFSLCGVVLAVTRTAMVSR